MSAMQIDKVSPILTALYFSDGSDSSDGGGVRQIEKTFLFDRLGYQALNKSEFSRKPQVYLCGQYSVGKTTFIKNLIGQEYDGSKIGPAPSTDIFYAVVHGSSPLGLGEVATRSEALPFQGLADFGANFLSKFNVTYVPSKRLENLIIIDSPGVLSAKQTR